MALRTGEEAAMRLFSALLVATGLTVTAAHAADTTFASERLFVGKTNILCVQAPCPWRGIAAADGQQTGPAGLLWAEQTLPPLDATQDDATRIVQAWNDDQCLSIQGRMASGRLQVERVEGECP
jgi:hypothetical protein